MCSQIKEYIFLFTVIFIALNNMWCLIITIVYLCIIKKSFMEKKIKIVTVAEVALFILFVLILICCS